MRELHRIRPEDPPDAFPPVTRALKEPNGLLAAGGDLSVLRMLAAYRRGIFPWYEAGQPILWWSPDPRTVLYPERFHASRSLRKTMRSQRLSTTEDRMFEAVLRSCAAPRDGAGGTWITTEMKCVYRALHEAGYAHSIETWQGDELVGGVFGVAIGRIFFAESMFSTVSDASKVALEHLTRRLQIHGFVLIDCQMDTAHLRSLGSSQIKRDKFIDLLLRFTDGGDPPGRWFSPYAP